MLFRKFKLDNIGRVYMYSGLSTFFGSINFALGTSNILKVINAPMATALIGNYLLKDVIGQTVGGVYSYFNSHKIDKSPKQKLIESLLLESTSIICDVVTPICPNYLAITSSSSILKNVSYVYFSSLNAKAVTSITKNENIAEVYSKLNIINSISSATGMCVGIYLIQYIHSLPILLFIMGTSHIAKCIAYYTSVKHIIV
jgi:hypothetical protein